MIELNEMQDLLPVIGKRTSVRNFLPLPVEKDKLIRILDAGRRAPSAKNRQPWRFVVIQEKNQKLRLLDACYGQECVRDAGAVIALCTTNVDYTMPNGQAAHPLDLSFAASFMMLQAEAEGLGTCIFTSFHDHMVREILTVPHSMKVLMLLLAGYPGERSESPERKTLDQIAAFEHW